MVAEQVVAQIVDEKILQSNEALRMEFSEFVNTASTSLAGQIHAVLIQSDEKHKAVTEELNKRQDEVQQLVKGLEMTIKTFST